MIEFEAERPSLVREEMQALLLAHWHEIALNKDVVPLDPNWGLYDTLEAAAVLHLTTARLDGALVGYAAYVIGPNLHYRSLIVAESDVFYISPAHRRGMTGARLIQAAERHLIAVGVNKIVHRVKLHKDVGALFERLGHVPIERVYAKLVG